MSSQDSPANPVRIKWWAIAFPELAAAIALVMAVPYIFQRLAALRRERG